MPGRKYSVNHDYFNIIDTENKAYWLGFIAADGYNDGKGKISINLSLKDKIHIRKFLSCIDSDYPILLNTAKLKNTSKEYEICFCSIRSILMSNALAEFGIIPGKAKTMDFPDNIRPDLVRHFMHGYWDGDGGFYKVGITYRGGVIANKLFLEKMQDIFSSECEVNKTKLVKKSKDGLVLGLNINGALQVRSVIHYLYDDCDIFLDRKMDMITNILYEIEKTPRQATINKNIAIAIKEASGTVGEIAEMFKITKTIVANIKTGKTWKNV